VHGVGQNNTNKTAHEAVKTVQAATNPARAGFPEKGPKMAQK